MPAPPKIYIAARTATGTAIEIPCRGLAPGYIPPGIGAEDYHIAPAFSHSGDYIGSESYILGEKTTITFQDIPPFWIEQVWSDTAENNYNGVARRIENTFFFLEIENDFSAVCWIDDPFPVPEKRTSGAYDLTMHLQG